MRGGKVDFSDKKGQITMTILFFNNHHIRFLLKVNVCNLRQCDQTVLANIQFKAYNTNSCQALKNVSIVIECHLKHFSVAKFKHKQ